MNPQSKEEALALADGIAKSVNEGSPDADVALFVPYVFIESVMDKVGDWINIGAEVSLCQTSFSLLARVLFIAASSHPRMCTFFFINV